MLLYIFRHCLLSDVPPDKKSKFPNFRNRVEEEAKVFAIRIVDSRKCVDGHFPDSIYLCQVGPWTNGSMVLRFREDSTYMVQMRRPKIMEALSEDALQRMWVELNGLYFAHRLPPIQIFLSSRMTSTAGLFISQNGPRQRWVVADERHGSGRMIRLSFPLHHGQAISTIRSTLAHEMIHQWQFDVKKCRPSHGREFHRLMDLMNRDGLDITVYHSLHKEAPALAKFVWQCTKCGRSYTRQRKTLSVKRHRCGECFGTLSEIAAVGMPTRVGEMQKLPIDLSTQTSLSLPIPVQLSFPFSLG